MDEQQKDKPDGLVVTDDNGNYYYLRPEILAQAKMPEEDLAKFKAGLAEASQGEDRELSTEEMEGVAGGMGGMPGNISIPGIPKMPELGSLKINTGSNFRLPGGASSMSTVMCPW